MLEDRVVEKREGTSVARLPRIKSDLLLRNPTHETYVLMPPDRIASRDLFLRFYPNHCPVVLAPTARRRHADLALGLRHWAGGVGPTAGYQHHRGLHRIYGRKGEVARPGMAIRADPRDRPYVCGDCARCHCDRVALLCDDAPARGGSPAKGIAKPAPCPNMDGA
jgi:hypothetical protein